MEICKGKYYINNAQALPVDCFNKEFYQLDEYIYEVIRVINGVPLFVEDHIERLIQTFSLKSTSIPYPFNDIIKQIETLIQINDFTFGNIKITYTYKPGNEENWKFLMYLTPHEYPTKEDYINGVDVRLFNGIRINPNAKVMVTELRKKANKIKELQNCYEILLINKQGQITEGSRSNVFFVLNDKVLTPPLTDVLPGVTRKNIIKICKNINYQVIESKISADEIEKFDAVFISGTSRKVLPVKRINELEYCVDNKIMRKIQQSFNEEIERYINDRLSSSGK